MQSEWEETLCLDVWLLQRNVIHDTFKLLNGDGGFWVGVVTGTRKTHIITFCVDMFRCFCHNHEAITTPSPLPQQAALREESGCSPPEGTARAEFFCVFHFIVEPLGGCCCVSIIAGLGVTPIWQDTRQLHIFFVTVTPAIADWSEGLLFFHFFIFSFYFIFSFVFIFHLFLIFLFTYLFIFSFFFIFLFFIFSFCGNVYVDVYMFFQALALEPTCVRWMSDQVYTTTDAD